jgi:hypothetical protein
MLSLRLSPFDSRHLHPLRTRKLQARGGSGHPLALVSVAA